MKKILLWLLLLMIWLGLMVRIVGAEENVFIDLYDSTNKPTELTSSRRTNIILDNLAKTGVDVVIEDMEANQYPNGNIFTATDLLSKDLNIRFRIYSIDEYLLEKYFYTTEITIFELGSLPKETLSNIFNTIFSSINLVLDENKINEYINHVELGEGFFDEKANGSDYSIKYLQENDQLLISVIRVSKDPLITDIQFNNIEYNDMIRLRNDTLMVQFDGVIEEYFESSDGSNIESVVLHQGEKEEPIKLVFNQLPDSRFVQDDKVRIKGKLLGVTEFVSEGKMINIPQTEVFDIELIK